MSNMPKKKSKKKLPDKQKKKARKKTASKSYRDISSFFADNVFYLAIYALVLIVMVNFFINLNVKYYRRSDAQINKLSTPEVLAIDDQVYQTTPQLKSNFGLSFPIISAQGAVAIDLDSETTLYEKNPDIPMLPASTVKIVTALVAMEQLPMSQIVRVNGTQVEGQKMNLVTGEELTIRDLIQGLLVFSANDAGEVIAESYPGGREEFVKAMNVKAEQLGLKNTRFTNPTGLDGINQFTTANDLIRVSRYAMQDPVFAEIVGKKSIEIQSIDGTIVHRLTSTNQLLDRVDGVLGIKTGWTESAQENLVVYVERDGRRIMLALLGSQDRFGEAEKLIEWIFTNYEWREVLVEI